MTAFRLLPVAILALATTTFAKPSPAPAGAPLPRHGTLGATVGVKAGHVVILSVFPDSAAQRAGLLAGDAITAVDGVAVSTVAGFLADLRRPAGQIASLGLLRAGKESIVAVVLRAPPDEQDPSFDTIYDSIEFRGTPRRTLITMPRGGAGRRPAVLFVGGIGCFSVDVASNPNDPYRNFARDLSRKGFVTMRLEKSGVGDSQGPPCNTVDFETESASYFAALQALRSDSRVDPARIYIFGHSIGGIIAPRLAALTRVAGIVVAETVGEDWLTYELINAQRDLRLSGLKPDAVDAAMLDTVTCKYRFLIGKEPAAELIRAVPACADDIAYPAPQAYMEQVAALNISEPWMKLDVPAIIVYGTSDFVTSLADHQRLADTVNGARAGLATLRIIDGMDHDLTVAASEQASYDHFDKGVAEPHDARFSSAVLDWLCARERCA